MRLGERSGAVGRPRVLRAVARSGYRLTAFRSQCLCLWCLAQAWPGWAPAGRMPNPSFPPRRSSTGQPIAGPAQTGWCRLAATPVRPTIAQIILMTEGSKESCHHCRADGGRSWEECECPSRGSRMGCGRGGGGRARPSAIAMALSFRFPFGFKLLAVGKTIQAEVVIMINVS